MPPNLSQLLNPKKTQEVTEAETLQKQLAISNSQRHVTANKAAAASILLSIKKQLESSSPTPSVSKRSVTI